MTTFRRRQQRQPRPLAFFGSCLLRVRVWLIRFPPYPDHISCEEMKASSSGIQTPLTTTQHCVWRPAIAALLRAHAAARIPERERTTLAWAMRDAFWQRAYLTLWTAGSGRAIGFYADVIASGAAATMRSCDATFKDGMFCKPSGEDALRVRGWRAKDRWGRPFCAVCRRS